MALEKDLEEVVQLLLRPWLPERAVVSRRSTTAAEKGQWSPFVVRWEA